MIYVLGGGIKAFAVIKVTYPSGSTCTCTNNEKTLVAKDTGGSWMFLLPSGGNWSVTCHTQDGSKTTTQTITDIKQYSVHSITLAYSWYLIQNGKLVNDFKFTSTLISNRTLNQVDATDTAGIAVRRFSNTAAGYPGGIATSSMVDVTPYSFAHLDYSIKTMTSTNKPGCILTKTLNASDLSKAISQSLATGYNESTARGRVDINIQNINEACYLGVYVTATSAAINSIDVYNFWLE